MVYLQTWEGDCLKIWNVTMNMMNKQLLVADSYKTEPGGWAGAKNLSP
jgi:hypothetical protein